MIDFQYISFEIDNNNMFKEVIYNGSSINCNNGGSTDVAIRAYDQFNSKVETTKFIKNEAYIYNNNYKNDINCGNYVNYYQCTFSCKSISVDSFFLFNFTGNGETSIYVLEIKK